MVLPFCTALDPEILKGGGMTCACLLTVRKCIQTKKNNIKTSYIPISPVFHLSFPVLCFVSLLYNSIFNTVIIGIEKSRGIFCISFIKSMK